MALRPYGLAAGLIGGAGPAAAGEIVDFEAEAGPAAVEVEAQAGPEVAVALQGELLTLDARGAPLAAVLEAVAAEAGFALVMKGDLDRPVTQRFEDLALDRAIRRVVGRDALLMRYARAPPGRQLVEVHVRAASGAGVVRRPPAAAMMAARPTRVGEVRRLARRGDAGAVADLARRLEQDDDGVVRRLVVESLGEIGDPRAIPAIGAALREDPDPNIRRMAARALGRMDQDAALAALEAARSDPNDNVRASIEAALTRAADAP